VPSLDEIVEDVVPQAQSEHWPELGETAAVC
jgi:hypothetical protein